MLYCSGSMCVGVTVWFGWGGVVSLCRLAEGSINVIGWLVKNVYFRILLVSLHAVCDSIMPD